RPLASRRFEGTLRRPRPVPRRVHTVALRYGPDCAVVVPASAGHEGLFHPPLGAADAGILGREVQGPMNVLVFTSLYPNNVWPDDGVFVRAGVARSPATADCRVKVVAPVPYFPPVKLGHRWLYSQIARREIRDGIDVYHPRYAMIPKVAMAAQGMTLCL